MATAGGKSLAELPPRIGINGQAAATEFSKQPSESSRFWEILSCQFP